MAVRKQKKGEHVYYEWVENSRKGHRVPQKVLCYLGEFSSPYEAITGLPERIAECRKKRQNGRAAQLTKRLKKLQGYKEKPEYADDFLPDARLRKAVAGLKPEEADALLARAQAESLSVAQLRELVAASRPEPEPAPLGDRSKEVTSRLKAAIGERQNWAPVPGAEKVRKALQLFIAEIESFAEDLKRLAFKPPANPDDDDRATDDDLRKIRYGRRL